VTPEDRVLRVVLADDNPVVRLGLTSLLESTGQLLVVAAEGDGRAAIEAVHRERPDVVLLDVRMPIVDGVVATQALSGQFPVLVLTHSEEPVVVERALAAGARGYFVHGTYTADELVRAVLGTADGQSHLSPPAAAAMMAAVRRPEAAGAPPGGRPGPVHDLSDREVEVMELIAKGVSNRDIAGELFLSEKTVKNYVNHIFAKLHVVNRAAAIARWLGTDDR
jgi:DNA-binding NarL/FixJ family response regulator